MKRLGLSLVLSSLAACSGSIFSETPASPPPPPAPASPPPSNNRPLVQEGGSVSSDGPGRSTGLVERPSGEIPPQRRGRVVTDVSTLNIFEILAPSKMSEWTEKMNDRQKKDFLARLSLDIVIGKAVQHDERAVRIVSFYIARDGKNVTMGNDPKAPWVSVSMEVNKDTPEEGLRAFVASGHLQSPDYPTQQSPFFALSLKFKTGKKNTYVMSEGKFIDYVDGDPQKGYRLNNNTLIRVSIQ